ncbi:MAG: transcription-repair coupling factor [Clostridia bacterium]
MTIKTDPLLQILSLHPEYVRFAQAIGNAQGPAAVFGLGEAHRTHIAAAIASDTNRSLLIVSANDVLAARMQEDISAFADNCMHFPARDIPLSGKGVISGGVINERRLAVLLALCSGKRSIIIASASALMQGLVPKEAFASGIRTYHTGECIEPIALLRQLVNSGYERVELCEGRGQVCQRGGYIDVFPLTSEYPVRIEFFDDEIDTMREYDALTQRSIQSIDEVTICPALETPLTDEARVHGQKKLMNKTGLEDAYEALSAGGVPVNATALLPFFYEHIATLSDYLPKDIAIFIDEPARIEESAMMAHSEFMDALSGLILSGDAQPEQAHLIHLPSEMIKRLDTPRTAMLFALTRTYGLISPKCIFRFETRAATKYIGGDDILKEDIEDYRRANYTLIICAGAHAERLRDRLMDMDIVMPAISVLERSIVPGESIIIGRSLYKGFDYPELKLAVLSENELFGSVSKKTLQPKHKRPQLAFSELEVGDLVVHELHGIGRFIGVETLTVGDVTRDYLNISYAGADKLYIPTDQLDRVQKYIGGDDAGQKLSKLGSEEWQKTVSRTRESVKTLAFDLVRLYGERSKRKGYKFAADTAWQRRMEESFPYEETPDQLTSIEEIKRDMESEKVMDRLLCGDVGYGKTEVALRAVFKAVMDGKQAALLVPTTILAQQHYNTLVARFSGFPVVIGLLSRFKSQREEKDILQKLLQGSMDVVVGTHKLLSKSVKFRDLGLLIIDEEQRFGVGHKELIKTIKKNVDVLSLSATPIPRTLHMSMTGIRDMSVIETPPEQRYPVQTYVMEYSDAVVREAIIKELARGGQTYFVYNRVRTMEHFAAKLKELVPEARIAFAHGQMNEHVLEKTMMDFMDQQYDVLLCSTIIESGMDIQNVNTIIVYDADCMGLSQLYQLRGRVGRGNRLGYAYLTFKRDKALSEIAEKRLTAIREFTQFGSGFKVAMRDLEIRGAGNLLGPEQHGHMQAVGYDLYCKLVDGAVREAKGEKVAIKIDTSIEIPISASIPKTCIPREIDRLSMYKRIAMIETQDDVLDVRDELIDRYGDIPKQVDNLMYIAKLKADCSRAYITRLSVKDGETRITFDGAAPMNGEKLLELVNDTHGAQLINGDTPMLIIKHARSDVTAICAVLPQFVYMLGDCIER